MGPVPASRAPPWRPGHSLGMLNAPATGEARRAHPRRRGRPGGIWRPSLPNGCSASNPASLRGALTPDRPPAMEVQPSPARSWTDPDIDKSRVLNLKVQESSPIPPAERVSGRSGQAKKSCKLSRSDGRQRAHDLGYHPLLPRHTTPSPRTSGRIHDGQARWVLPLVRVGMIESIGDPQAGCTCMRSSEIDHGHRIVAHLAGTDRVIGRLGVVVHPVEDFIVGLGGGARARSPRPVMSLSGEVAISSQPCAEVDEQAVHGPSRADRKLKRIAGEQREDPPT